MHRVDGAILGEGALRGDQALRQDLTAVDAPGRHRMRCPGEDVLGGARLRDLEVEHVEQSFDGPDGVVFGAHSFLSATAGTGPLVV